MQSGVFLDRDNTLILNEGDLGDPALVKIVEGTAKGLRALRDAGYRLVVVTNQGGVARGKYTEADVDAVNQRIAALVDEIAGVRGVIDRFYYCPYHPEGTVAEYRRDHPWRKPHPGMLLQAARDMEIDLATSWMIGDQERDIVAGRSAGCRTVLVQHDGGKRAETTATVAAGNFDEAVKAILTTASSRPGIGNRSAVKTIGNGEASRDPGVKTSSEGQERAAPGGKSGGSAGAVVKKQVEGGASARASGGAGGGEGGVTLEGLRRAVGDLTEEVRSERMRRGEFGLLRMSAAAAQLLAGILAILGLLQISASDIFMKWMMCAVLAQLAALTLLAMDNRG